MKGPRDVEPIRAQDDEIERHLRDAQLPSLLVALAHVTGDDSLLQDDLRPEDGFLAAAQGGYDEARCDRARALCLDALRRHRDAGCPTPPPPDDARLRRWLEFLARQVDLDRTLPVLKAELALDGADVRAPAWRKSTVAPERSFRVAIIGAGMSGLVAALRLQQAEIPFVIFEKSDGVGGTWHDNVYPGCRVDVSNHFYSYSFAQRLDWPQLFSPQEVLLDYFRTCADRFDLRRHVRFGTEVTEAVFDEARGVWNLGLRTSDGATERFEAQAIVSAVGQLNRPSWLDIPGREDFRGPAFHSARWRTDVPLEGRRVGVIGTGASACQLIPPVADQADSLVVFQRTAPWLLPTPDYHAPVPEGLRWLFEHVPHYAAWYRFWIFWTTSEGLLGSVEVEDDWPHPERSVGRANDAIREMLTAYLAEACAGDQALFEKMLPDYPPFAKRFVRDDGLLPATYRRDDVTLETTGIERITERGVRLVDGREVELDVLIYGTGFKASDFLVPMTIVGRGGRSLHDVWQGDARAHLGITLPGFPNLFLLYGPNTNIVVNGSIIYFSECEVDYLVDCLRFLLEGGHAAIDCRSEAHDAYNRRIDAANRRRAWGASDVSAWYKNRFGRVSQNWPWGLLAYWDQTRAIDPAEYEVLGSTDGP
ncbi:MAG: NAD(P)/FAD-dependent oxidoreductase [Spirochaetaceae bacterium]|nr:NAD(P)/FAD-dependent oxidoreductase [Spirochaetaceae bacterium]